MENIKSRELLPEAAPFALWAIFFSPLATIESLSRRPRWFIPLLIAGIYSTAVSYYVIARFGFAALVAKSAQASSQLDPDMVLQHALANKTQIIVVQSIATFLGAFATSALIALILWLLVILVGETRYSRRCWLLPLTSLCLPQRLNDAGSHGHTEWRSQLFQLQQPTGNQPRLLCPQQLQVYRSHFQRARHRHDRHSGPAGIGVDQGFQTSLPDRGMACGANPVGDLRRRRRLVHADLIIRLYPEKLSIVGSSSRSHDSNGTVFDMSALVRSVKHSNCLKRTARGAVYYR